MVRLKNCFITAIVSLLAMGVVSACGESRTPNQSEAVALSAPTNVQADFWKLTWDEVENASGYVVILPNGDERETTESSFELFEYCVPNKTYELEVKAKGDGINYTDSNWTTVDYETEKVTSGLQYKLLDDGTCSIYISPSKIPSNGELVLPDRYEGSTVSCYIAEPKLLIGNAEPPSYKKIKKIRLPANLKELPTGLYQSSIEEIYLPKSLEKIGAAFQESLYLKKVEIPENVKYLTNSFRGCASLEEVTMPDEFLEVGKYTFDGTKWYENQPDGMLYVGNVACQYKGEMPENTSIQLREDTKSISNFAFENQTNLVSVTIPEGITEIPGGAFRGCTNLQEVNLPQSVESIGGASFADCKSLKQIKLPENLKKILWRAFENSGLTSVKIPQGVSLSFIGFLADAPFGGCESLREIVLPQNFVELPTGFFWGTGIQSWELADGCTNMPGFFFDCKELEYIVIPTSIKRFAYEDVYHAEKLTTFFYKGTEEEWSQVEIVDSSFFTTPEDDWEEWFEEFWAELTVYYYSEDPPQESGKYWRYVDGVPTVWE